MTITLLELRDAVRQRADMKNSTFVEDAELTSYINASIAELHDLLLADGANDYALRSVPFSTINGTATYTLPNGTLYSNAPAFYKLRGVDVALNGVDYFTLKNFNFNERNKNTNINWGVQSGPNLRYRLVGNNLTFSPAPTGVYNCQLWYVPVATKLVADADVLDDLNQYSEYVVVDAAIKCLQKEESDVQVLLLQKSALAQRIRSMAQNRDSGEGESISDIYRENSDNYFNRG